MTEDDQAPDMRHLKVYIPALVTLAARGDQEARDKVQRLAADKDSRTRVKVLLERLDARSEDCVSLLEVALCDLTAEVREAAIRQSCCVPGEVRRLVPLLARALNDPAQRLHVLAVKALLSIQTRDEGLLASIYPFMEWMRPLLPCPSGATNSQREEIDRKNKEQSAWDYTVRRSAIAAVCYWHESLPTQHAL